MAKAKVFVNPDGISVGVGTDGRWRQTNSAGEPKGPWAKPPKPAASPSDTPKAAAAEPPPVAAATVGRTAVSTPVVASTSANRIKLVRWAVMGSAVLGIAAALWVLMPAIKSVLTPGQQTVENNAPPAPPMAAPPASPARIAPGAPNHRTVHRDEGPGRGGRVGEWGDGKDMFKIAGTPPGYEISSVNEPKKSAQCQPPRHLFRTDVCKNETNGDITCVLGCE